MTPRTPRPAFTLFEMVLVVAVIGILAALSAPSIQGMYGSYKLIAATDQLRAAWATGRAKAIEEARPYRFTAHMGQSTYHLAPDSPNAAMASPSPAGPAGPGLNLSGSLPGGVIFGSTQNGSGGQGAPGGGPNVVFLPDGTASEDVAITLRVPGAMPALVKLRALTGVVTVQVGRGHL
jgi:prepilin-type N-terminal cleavage/methylation domain-containing protein